MVFQTNQTPPNSYTQQKKEMVAAGHDLPPGFRFHPTDEELIIHYLKKQATSCPVSTIIPEVDIYKFDPWQLPDKSGVGEKEWYFFTPRDRKYPNGVRPNRAAVSGYWKATGTDKAIYSGSRYVGVKKSLVFYRGRPPKGIKTDWIMHEYRLSDSRPQPYKPNGSMRLDDWVLCRIYKKKKKSLDYDNTTAGDEVECRDNMSCSFISRNTLLHTAHHHHHVLSPFPRNINIHSLYTSSPPHLLHGHDNNNSIQHMMTMRGSEDFFQTEPKYHQPITSLTDPAFQMH